MNATKRKNTVVRLSEEAYTALEQWAEVKQMGLGDIASRCILDKADLPSLRKQYLAAKRNRLKAELAALGKQ